MAGQGLAKYAADPNTLSQLGKRVAMETAVNTAAAQAIPRIIGATPPPLGRTVLSTGLHSAFSAPVAGGMRAMGVPDWAAQTAGQVAGVVGAQKVSSAITPEPQQQPQVQGIQFEQLQQMNAAAEQQRYHNEINLALAKNYSHPSTIIHKNPSADLQNIANLLSMKVQY